MTFLSSSFLLWMAAVVFIQLCLPRRYQLTFVAVATITFLLTYSPWSALALCMLLVVSYFVMTHWSNRNSVILLVIFCISTLFIVYKYCLRQAPSTSGTPDWLLLGASFYVLKIIHYILDSYKGTLQRHNFFEYLHFMLFLPVIVIGPINRFNEFLREQRRRRWDSHQFATGLERILYGYVKILLIAGYIVGPLLDSWIASRSTSEVWLIGYLSCLKYGLDLYFKFSGYSDIAIGFAALLGIRIIENFNYPFLKSNISMFWKSWHISLSSWCRDYVYMPIAAHYRRPYIGILASMLVLGLWHELSMRYVLWGMYHGIGIAVWQYFQNIKPKWLTELTGSMYYLAYCISVLLTFNFVVLSFQITKSEDIVVTITNIYRNSRLLLIGD